MDTVVLVACAKAKLPRPAPARELYTSQLFRKSLAYAESLRPAATYILSARHGLVELDQVLEPYDATLRDLTPHERMKWGGRVLAELMRREGVERKHVVFLAGKLYREPIQGVLGSTEAPLAGLGMGGGGGFQLQRVR